VILKGIIIYFSDKDIAALVSNNSPYIHM